MKKLNTGYANGWLLHH